MIDQSLVIRKAHNEFMEYIRSLLLSRKYYYWELDYFKRIDYLDFKQYVLCSTQKEYINSQGKEIFFEKEIVFSIEMNSVRNELHINNIRKILTSFTKHLIYLKEYVLLYIMENDKESIFSNEIKEIQKNNFIYTYLLYALENEMKPQMPEFVSFTLTSSGKEVDENIIQIIKSSVNDEVINDIKSLRKRIGSLMIQRNIQSNISFLYEFPKSQSKEELRFALERLSHNQKELYFRGQANSDWTLESSVTRQHLLLKKENDLFQDIITLKPHEFLNDKSDYEKLITMQHFSLPTRLLDITRNPLIALFFACNNIDEKNKDGMVYIFADKKLLNPDDKKVECLTKIIRAYDDIICDICIEKDGCKIREEDFLRVNHFIKGVAKNQRINNQSGDFIFEGLGGDSKKNEHLENEVTGYLIIDYKVKPILLENLEAMNIHGGSVYPDLSNMSNYLANKYKNGSRV